MSPARIFGVAFSRSFGSISSHLPFGIDSTTPVPKKRLSAKSPTAAFSGSRWIGAFTWVEVWKMVDDLVRHHAVLGVVGDALELDLLVAGEDRRIHAPGMAELVELHPRCRGLSPAPFQAPQLDESCPAPLPCRPIGGRKASRSGSSRCLMPNPKRWDKFCS